MAKLQQYERVMQVVENLCSQIPAVAELLKIQGLGLVTIAELFAEIGDIRRFESPRQLQKLAGLAITENSFGKHNGPTEISRRGRAILFRTVIPLLAKNQEFQLLHRYYTTRPNNPLQKIQSAFAICCKLLRVFYAVATKGCACSPEKILADIQSYQPLKAA
ncbi:MAG: transposase [Candidatus Merdivicinus sp.]|jgi:transposase